jgi:hypothetical protein
MGTSFITLKEIPVGQLHLSRVPGHPSVEKLPLDRFFWPLCGFGSLVTLAQAIFSSLYFLILILISSQN